VTPFVAKVVSGLPDFDASSQQLVAIDSQMAQLRRTLITSDPGCFNQG
jgi:hypothetical protein